MDATLQEEACSLASLLVSVTSKGALTSVKKMGKGSLDPESIFEMMEVRGSEQVPGHEGSAHRLTWQCSWCAFWPSQAWKRGVELL